MAYAVNADPISQLEEDLECTVCLEVLKDPRTLPCCHSFCKDCLEGVVQACRDTAPQGQPVRDIPCPNCRATFPLDPDKHVADMPRNHFICNLVKVTAVLDRGIGVPCSHNCSQSYSVARCVTCEKFLCRECLTDHNKYRGNNGHSVLTMEELSKPENRKKIKDKMYCNEHSDMILKVYCETCNQLICRDCMDFKHVKQEGHSCSLVKDVANNYKELLASSNKAMEVALTQGIAFVRRLSLTSKQLDGDAEDAKVEIAHRKESMAKKFLEMLDQKAECLSKKVDEIHKAKRASLDQQTEETNQFVENIKTSVQLSKKLVDQGTEEEIISSQKMMLDNANNLAKREEYFKASIPVAKFRYTGCVGREPINEKILTGMTDTLGEVVEESEDTSPKTLKIAEADLKWRKHLKPLTRIFDELEDTPRADQSERNIEPDESLNINSLFLRYIISYHYEEYQMLENVSKEISFEVPGSVTERRLKIFARKDVDKKTYLKTLERFIKFCQYQNQKMLQEITPKENKDTILEARTRFSLVIDSAQDNDEMVIYGEREKVQVALKFLKSKVADSTTSTASSSSAPEGATRASSPNPKSTAEEKVIVDKLSCVLYEIVKVCVYQGDFTKETADVIVNPANEELKHIGGTAGAIVKAGGKLIQDESNSFMKERRYQNLKPGEVALTGAGNLPCKFIIHAVGPKWADYYFKDSVKRDLFNVVYNCLTTASQNGATSISIPAIGSGIFGIPVDICAEVLFTAVKNFATNSTNTIPLKEIRFVNIDKPTTQAFAREMKKRFGCSIKQESVEIYSNDGAKNPVGQQNQFGSGGKHSPMNSCKGTGAVDEKITLVSYTKGHSTSGSEAGNSHLNPDALPFVDNDFFPKPPSYSNAVREKVTKGPDKMPAPDLKDVDKEECSICLGDITDKKTLNKCGHSFCARCINEAFKHQTICTVCSTVYGTLIGNQPPGKMTISRMSLSLSGYESCGTITILYKFEDGVQGPEHPNPGKKYFGTTRSAYLPDNDEGNKVLKLLEKAFRQKLTFTIGRSSTTGCSNVITWNDIHHKTRQSGGATNFGYPDPNYLKRVQEELAAKGITE